MNCIANDDVENVSFFAWGKVPKPELYLYN